MNAFDTRRAERAASGPAGGGEHLLLPELFFDGPVRGWGLFEDRRGRVRREFTLDVVGQWDGQRLELDESIAYRDGETQRRNWRFVKHAGGRYEAWTDDVVGKATGLARGSTFHWRYVLRMPAAGRLWHVSFDDWMYLQPDGVVINIAQARKFGIRIGRVILFFRRQSEPELGSIPVSR